MKTRGSRDSSRGPKAEQKQIATELRLAKHYWLRTVHPYIENRRLRDAEWGLAILAYEYLVRSYNTAVAWNANVNGLSYPIIDVRDPRWRSTEFHPPIAESFGDEVDPIALASFASASLPRLDGQSAEQAIAAGNEALHAVQRFVDNLPKRGRDHRLSSLLQLTVTVDQIMASVQTDVKRIPLVIKKTKGVDKENKKAVSISRDGVRKALNRFFAREICDGFGGGLGGLGEVKKHLTTEEELLRGRVRLMDLCQMRWSDFKRFSLKQQRNAQRATTTNRRKRRQ